MKKFLGILLVLIIAALIAALIYFKGFGGFGKDSGEGKKDDVSVSQTTESTEASTEATTTDEEKTETAEITVSGHDYLFNNEKMTLEALTAEIAKLDKEAQITITSDDTAAKNTVDELTDKLDELGYKNYKKLDK
ncbi:hypothetical protein [Ruminococcus flavefaciens]|uniref:hypothetical protein n=1 Tax=Ruminococcus flavefaciens TaxID=1265 RepID=UPI0026E965C8|nr:hypothetical protein [Ruminococcus flavefaciens]